jgi:hypothetical protein
MTPTLRWQTSVGKGVAVHAPEGSYPARRAAAELKEAERTVSALEELLSPPAERRGPVDIYLADAIAADEPDGGRVDDALVRVVQPEAPGEPIAYPLTRTLVRRWFGPQAGSASLFVEGVAGVVAGRLEGADDRVREELGAGNAVSIFAQDSEHVATSFVGFLLRTFGAESLRELLAEYDPERRDQAAVSAYQRPLAALEELWLAGLRQVSGSSRS